MLAIHQEFVFDHSHFWMFFFEPSRHYALPQMDETTGIIRHGGYKYLIKMACTRFYSTLKVDKESTEPSTIVAMYYLFH